MDKSISAQQLTLHIPRKTSQQPSSPPGPPGEIMPAGPGPVNGSQYEGNTDSLAVDTTYYESKPVTTTDPFVKTSELKTETVADLTTSPCTVAAGNDASAPAGVSAETEPDLTTPVQVPAVTTRRRTSILKQPLEAALNLEEPVKTTEKAVKFNSTDGFITKTRTISDDHLYNISQMYIEHDDRPDDVRHDSSDFDGLSKDQQKFFYQVSDALEHEILKSKGPVGILKQIQYFLTCTEVSPDYPGYWKAPENKARKNWPGSADFVIASVCCMLNCTYTWRFPQMCLENGGFVFLIMYLVMMTVFGIPLFILESLLSQFTSRGILSILRISPLFKGVGYSMLALLCFNLILNNTTLAWLLYYFYLSFQDRLPWSFCDNPWNDYKCNLTAINCEEFKYTQVEHGLCLSVNRMYGPVVSGIWNVDAAVKAGIRPQHPATQFFLNYMARYRGIADTISFAAPSDACICLSLVCLVTMAGSIKGIQLSGKIMHFTFSWAVLSIMVSFCYALTLPNAVNGIDRYLKPDLTVLYSPQAWTNAIMESIYSLSIGLGVIHTLSSYNRFHTNTLASCVTSVVLVVIIYTISGLTTVCWMGNLVAGSRLERELIKPGLHTSIVSLPAAFDKVAGGAQALSALFYSSVLCIGATSQIFYYETFVSVLADDFMWIRERKSATCFFTAALLYSLSLPFSSSAGLDLIAILDYIVSGFPLVIVLLLEVWICMWVYGYTRFSANMEAMLTYRLQPMWKYVWKYICPSILLAVYFLLMFTEDYLGVTEQSEGIIITMLPLILLTIIPAYMIFRFYYSGIYSGGLTGILEHETKASVRFGPALIVHQNLIRGVVDNESMSIPSDFKSMEVSALSALVRGVKPSPQTITSTNFTLEDNSASTTNIGINENPAQQNLISEKLSN